ncbi:NAD(P)-dependent oxidoreductase [Horticoccus sp. 23ND18S-11]|uniref:NAD(P)-dependent oxidoreductase n=1 Tax=Horticoccus sp. 23ND18S-11 TaxID=3391832 RepID=UPI0039C8E40C
MSSLPRLWTDVPLHRAALDLLRGRVALSGPTVPAGDAAQPPFAFADADAAIVGTRQRYDAEAFARATRLKVIARTGIGYDNVDVPAATAAGVCAVNTPEAPTESTAEFAIALMFAVARRIPAADAYAKAGVWKLDPEVMGFDLAGKSLGLVGFGRIARRVTEMARAIRLRVFAFDPFVPAAVMTEAGATPCANLSALLRSSYVLSLHAPLGDATRRLIGAEQLALLPAGAIVINTARGPLLDEGAVLAALESGQLAGAGLDVWEREPVAPDHPLFRHPRVVATSHIAAYTNEGRERSHVAAAQLVLAALAGERPATLIDPTAWAHRRT